MKRQLEESEEEKVSPRPTGKAFLKEVILENFMSYKYARTPLGAGLNIICGPNGSGKSSILLALSVALGQAYTERSRKLSDLIRRNENIARVTLLLDNSPIKGRRPIPKYNSDVFMLSRYLRKDGAYWYEAEYHEIPKTDVVKLLSTLGINPDNMLIIMHQNMVEEFSVIPPNQKLVMLEEAIGFQTYRQRILEAQERLTTILSEESSVSTLLANAEQTLQYWKEQYEKYIKKTELTEKKLFLEREMAWLHVIKLEKTLQYLQQEREKRNLRLNSTIEELDDVKKEVEETWQTMSKLRFEQNEAFFTLLNLEKEKSGGETHLKLSSQILSRIEEYTEFHQKIIEAIERENIDLKSFVGLNSITETMNKKHEEIHSWLLDVKSENQKIIQKTNELKTMISNLQLKLTDIERKLNSIQEKYVSKKVKEAILNFQKDELEEKIRQLDVEMEKVRKELDLRVTEAEKVGPRVETQRLIQEVSDDLKIITVQLVSMGDVSEETERMYKKYLKVYNELKEKTEIVAENKQRMLGEIEIRKTTWKKVLNDFFKNLNETYKSTLSTIGVTGEVKLINTEDTETAGLEISVGFHGLPPTNLDAYTQSGGERAVAIMAFLLSLQKYVKSPIRAIDEFDVHMDPRNREVISKLILSTIKTQPNTQYIVITPGQISFFDEESQVLMVQNVAGESEVKVVSKP